jgi:hypothetical protein
MMSMSTAGAAFIIITGKSGAFTGGWRAEICGGGLA